MSAAAPATTAKRPRTAIAAVPKSTQATDGARAVSAHDVLSAAGAGIAAHEAGRDLQSERSMRAALTAFNAIEGTHLSERQGWQLQALLKMTHAAAADRNGTFDPKDATSAAAYAALGGEAAAAAAGVTVQP